MSAILGGVTGVFAPPGFLSDVGWTPKTVLVQAAGTLNLQIGGIIDGTATRDATNTTNTGSLFPGLLMGLESSYGLWANAIIGLTTSATAGAATTIVVATATATELARRLGPSGTFQITGPPTSGGTVAHETVTYSAINTATGHITCTATSNAYVSGSLVQPLDGSQVIRGVLNQETSTVDINGNSQNAQMFALVVGGAVASTTLTNWPTDTSLIAYIKAALRAVGYGYIFTDDFGQTP